MLTIAGRPLTLKDFNIYVFYRLRHEFKDIVTTLVAYPTLVNYTKLYTLFLIYEFLHGDAFA